MSNISVKAHEYGYTTDRINNLVSNEVNILTSRSNIASLEMSDEHYFILKDIRRTHVTYLVMEVKTQELTMPKRSHFHSICTFFPELFQMTICHQNGIFAYKLSKQKDVVACRAACRNRKRGIANNPPEIAINGLDYWFRANSLPALIASMFRGIRPW